MKKIEAYIRHEAFEPIRMELLDLGFPSLTISEVKGSGRQKGIIETYRGAVLTNYLRPKIKLECVVADEDVQTIVDTILKHGRTGAVGDGKVFVHARSRRPTASGPASPARRSSRPTPTPLPRPRRAEASVNGAAGSQTTARRPAARYRRARRSSRGCARCTCEMVDAVLHGDGLERVAAARGRGGRRRPSRSSCRGSAPRSLAGGASDGPLEELRRYVDDRVRDRPAEVPDGVRGRGADHQRRRAGRRGAAAGRRRAEPAAGGAASSCTSPRSPA